MTMVLAMIPAVSATDETSGSTSSESSTSTPAAEGTAVTNPYVMYVGDTQRADDFWTWKCGTSNHTSTIKCTLYYSDGTPVNSSSSSYNNYNSYVSYNSSTGKVTASTSTLSTSDGEERIAKYEISCSTSGCAATTEKPAELYYKVYSKASSVTVTTSTTSTSNSSSITTLNVPKNGTKIYYSISPVTANTDLKNVKAVYDQTVLTVTGPAKDEAGKTYFEVKPQNSNASTTSTLKIVADVGTTHEKESSEITVYTGSEALLVLTDSSKNEVGRSTNANNEIKTINASTSTSQFKLTATVTPTDNNKKIYWSSSNSAVVRVDNTTTTNGTGVFNITGSGVATLTATYNEVTAKVKVSVLSDIESIKILDSTTSKNLTSTTVEKQKGDNDIVVTVEVTPEEYEKKSAKYTVWSTSDEDVVDFVTGTDKEKDSTYDRDTHTMTGASVKLKINKAGTATITAQLGSNKNATQQFKIKVTEAAETVTIQEIPTAPLTGTVRKGTATEIVDQMNANSLYCNVWATKVGGQSVSVPIEWNTATVNSDGTATVRGQVKTSDGERNFVYTCSTEITAKVTLTDKPAITKIAITASKDIAVENDSVTLTANATVAPSGSTLSYQWYVNGTAISKGTSKSVTYTIPKSSVDSSTAYKFTCEVTAENNEEKVIATSDTYTVTVSRDYSISLAASNGKTSFHVGDDITMKATLYYKGTAVTSTSFSWQLLNSSENSLDSAIATIAGNGSSATITSKAADSADGSKITVRATVSYNGYSYSSSETITLYPAEAATFKQSVGSGATIKASSITSAVSSASGQTPSYVVFSSASGCTLTTSSTSSSSVGSTKCYVSASSGQSLSSVYVKPSSTTGSVKYTAYNAGGYAIATGSVSFDSEESNQTVYGSGASFKASGAADQILEAYPSAAYVKFELPSASTGHLFYGFNTIADFSAEVSASEKYYFDASSSQNDVEDVYFLPTYGVTGTVKISYTAYSSSNSDLGDGTISLSIQKKTASSKFTDVTYNNTGYWAADSIDFMADNGLFNGTSTYNFSPNASMTRAMLVTVLYRAAGEPSVSGVTNPFTDIKKDYYYNAVLWAYKNNIVTGTSANKFSPDANVTREQIASILYRYMDSPTATGSLVGYTDRTKISAYAATAMQWAIGEGYITGTTPTSLDPTGNATRAQVAVIMHRFITK